jgi:hypothetical protein
LGSESNTPAQEGAKEGSQARIAIMQYKFTEIQKKLQYGLLKCHSIPTKESERLETLEQQQRRNKVS